MASSRNDTRARQIKEELRMIAFAIFLAGVIVGALMMKIFDKPVSAKQVHNETKTTAVETAERSGYSHDDKELIACDVQKEDNETKENYEWMQFTATAYCSCKKCCDGYADNRPLDSNGNEIVYTASGKKAVQGVTIAADWNVLPKGTVIEMEGYGTFEVQDKGAAIVENKIDVYFDSHEEALEWGVKKVNIRVITNGGDEK